MGVSLGAEQYQLPNDIQDDIPIVKEHDRKWCVSLTSDGQIWRRPWPFPSAFKKIAEKLRDQAPDQLPYNIVLVGGAVSVLSNIRTATEDIDFFMAGQDDSDDQMARLEEVAEGIANELGLSQSFMNSNVRLFINNRVFEPAIERTWTQNQRVFQSRELNVFVADYGYQLVSKLERISMKIRDRQAVLPKDLTDATFYLHSLIKKKNKIARGDVVGLYPSDGYTPYILDESLDMLEANYQTTYGEVPWGQWFCCYC